MGAAYRTICSSPYRAYGAVRQYGFHDDGTDRATFSSGAPIARNTCRRSRSSLDHGDASDPVAGGRMVPRVEVGNRLPAPSLPSTVGEPPGSSSLESGNSS